MPAKTALHRKCTSVSTHGYRRMSETQPQLSAPRNAIIEVKETEISCNYIRALVADNLSRRKKLSGVKID